jgi:hypothetical protein
MLATAWCQHVAVAGMARSCKSILCLFASNILALTRMPVLQQPVKLLRHDRHRFPHPHDAAVPEDQG